MRLAVRSFARYYIKSITHAAGDGVTDDTQALILARDQGLPLDGGGLIYAIKGPLSLINDSDFANVWFRQLAPAASSEVRTLTISSSADRTRLNDVTVDRNGDGTVGQTAGGGAAGIYLTGGRDHHWGRVEVFGSDKGQGIALRNAQDSDFDDLFVHDMFNEDATTTDQNLFGVTISGIRNCRMRVRVRNLFSKATSLGGSLISTGTYYGSIATGTAIVSATASSVVMASDASSVDDAYNAMQMVVIDGTGASYANTITDYTGATRTATFGIDWPVTLNSTSKVVVRTSRYSRGIAGSGCRDCQLTFFGSFLDEGCDITGGDHPGLQVLSGSVSDICTWGWKFANAQKYQSFGDLQAVRCGNSGFVFSGDTTQDIDGSGMVARDTGYGSIWSVPAGFRISAVSTAHPTGIRLKNVTAISSVGNMAYGAYSDASTVSSATPNEIDIRSIGHTIAPVFGLWERGGTRQKTVSANTDQSVYALGANQVNECNELLLDTPITADRTLTVQVGYKGATMLITRSAAATGAFDWIVKNTGGTTLTLLAVSQYCQLGHNGTDWYLSLGKATLA